MQRKRPGLGRLGTRFFELIQLKEKETVYLGDLQDALGISPTLEKKLLSQLARQGSIVRLQKGVYLAPTKLPPGGKWTPNEYTLISEYMRVIEASYQICGATAFNYYGLTEQIPNVISAYNDRVSGRKKVGSLYLSLIKVSIKRLGGSTTVTLPSSKQARISTLSRTLMDAVYDWQRFNSLPQAYEWIRQYSNDTKIMNELVENTSKFGNVTTKRRLGFLLNKMNLLPRKINQIHRSLEETSSWLSLDPTKRKRGKTDRKWGIVDNVYS